MLNFDLRHHTIVHVAGSATNVHKDDSTLEIHTAQYLSAIRTPDNVFPNIKRWESYNPIPGKGRSALIEGLLTGAERNAYHTVKHFIVDLQKVTFLSQAPSVATAKQRPCRPGIGRRAMRVGPPFKTYYAPVLLRDPEPAPLHRVIKQGAV
ncbi:hypothetical protein B0H13DRAFT_1888865 [Mycena leptocephala]|nr:hypothetical protein B0H13DRAFT_1888865 [Mycena leptocephala]